MLSKLKFCFVLALCYQLISGQLYWNSVCTGKVTQSSGGKKKKQVVKWDIKQAINTVQVIQLQHEQ